MILPKESEDPDTSINNAIHDFGTLGPLALLLHGSDQLIITSPTMTITLTTTVSMPTIWGAQLLEATLANKLAHIHPQQTFQAPKMALEGDNEPERYGASA